MSRREFPAKVRVEAWQRAGGCCEDCGVKIIAGLGPHYDHILPDALGGTPTADNCRVLCIPCHKAKTSAPDALSGGDVQKIAKAKRLAAKAAGVTGRKAVIPGSKASPWKRKVGGAVERRREEA